MNLPYENEEAKKAYFEYIDECATYTYLVQRIDDLQLWKYYSGHPKEESLTSTVELGEADYIKMGNEMKARLIYEERLKKIKQLKELLMKSWEKLSRNIYFKRMPVKFNKYHENLFF